MQTAFRLHGERYKWKSRISDGQEDVTELETTMNKKLEDGQRMESAVRWLKASYITGAVADGLIGILMLLPDRVGETEFRYTMGLGASLMFGWTALLVWAYKRPMERRGVLILTIFPVITGLVVTGIWAVAAGHFPIQKIVPSSILGTAITLLMGYSYCKATIAAEGGVT